MKELKLKNSFIEGPILPEKIADSIAKHQVKTQIGAHSIFLGQVRADKVDDKVVQAIEYTAYQEMAEKKIAEIREAIFEKYEDLTCMHVYQSLGIVKAGELCLFIFTSAGHRKQAQEACSEMVERLKSEVPIWGKELFEDETHQWKVNR